ncbi:hypothetical protein C3488_13100 [Streptomyces sp. Ru72]|nr:hypothetical protein C3488_13100 [Streptomyces sp. Ru72]
MPTVAVDSPALSTNWAAEPRWDGSPDTRNVSHRVTSRRLPHVSGRPPVTRMSGSLSTGVRSAVACQRPSTPGW